MARRSRKTRENRGAGAVRQLPWRQPVNTYPPLEILSTDQVEQIHLASLSLLENQGMRVMHEGARMLLAEAGAEVNHDTQMVCFERGLVMEKVAMAPSEIKLHARNPEKCFKLGGNHLAFTSVGGPAYCHYLNRGRRRRPFEEACDFLKLVQSLDIIHQEGGGPFEPIELPAETRHLDLYHAQIRLLDIEVRVIEQRAIAAWGEGAFLNHAGDVFTPAGAIDGGSLPELAGPAGSQGELMLRYKQVQERLQPLGLTVVALEMNPRGGLLATLAGGGEPVL